MMRRIFILTLVAITFAACKKEVTRELQQQAELQEGFNPKYKDIKPLILAFKAQAELSNSGMSKTTTMPDKTIEEAEWTMEGALNYDHAHPVQLYDGMHVDTLSITVSNNGTNSNGETMVDGDDLAQAYANLLTAINNLVPTGEDVDVIDVQAISSNNMFTTFKAFVSAGQPLTLVPDYVKPDDDWKAAQGLGKCDGAQVGLDATDRLEDIINFNIANNFTMNMANPQQVIFYTNVVTLSNGYYPWDQSANDILDIRTWWGGENAGTGYTWQSNSVNDCLDDSEMNMFHNRVWSTIYGAQSELAQNGYPPQGASPANRDVLNVDIDASWPLVGGTPFGFHFAQQVTFGIPVL